MSDDVTSDAGTAGAWLAVETLVDEVASLSRTELAADEFHQLFLKRAVEALAAVAAVLWIARGRQPLAIDRRVGFDELKLDGPAAEPDWQQQLAELARRCGQPLRLLPGEAAPIAGCPINPTPWVLLCTPFAVATRLCGVLIVFQRPGGSADAQLGYVHAAGALAELAADFHARQQLRELEQRETLWQRFEHWISHVYRTLDLGSLTHEIVNEGRRLIDCDRLTLALERHGECRLAAISAVDRFDPRSDLVRRLEELSRRATPSGQACWLTAGDADLDPATAQCFREYLRLSSVREIGLVPLEPDDAKVPGTMRLGVLIIERFTGRPFDAGSRARAEVVARHSAVALGHALDLDRLPLRRALTWLGSRQGAGAPRQLRRLAWGAAALVALMLALVFIPADFEVEARGTLEPHDRREVFATADALVDKILVRHGDKVDRGAVLLVLRSPQLEYETSGVAGEILTARKRLAAVQASRLGNTPNDPSALERYHQLTGEEEELKESLASLERQAALLRTQADQLTLRSPLAGHVLTWDVEPLLAARPVARGQALLTVADLDGAWELDLKIDDSEAGFVRSAQRERSDALPVSFVLAAAPQQVHEGRTERLALVADVDTEHRNVVEATVAIDRQSVSPLRPGATVRAKFACGRRSLGYVWFHKLWDGLRSWILL
jgi:multidrug efflux pump subunit AcrA (membrane-fusion protein)